MTIILLIAVIVLQIVLYKKIKNFIEVEFIRQHNSILVDTKNRVEDIYRDMEKRGLEEEDLEPAPEAPVQDLKLEKEMWEEKMKNLNQHQTRG